MNFQEIIRALENYWMRNGCLIEIPYDVEMGAGTLHPSTFLRALGPEPWHAAYVQPARRPADSRYGESPYRLTRHFQYQVIFKPAPDDAQEIYLESLRAIGIDPRHHDIKFMEDIWESHTLGASGIGWQVWLDGLEITQFTYFQTAGGLELQPVSLELTYGLERIAMVIQDVDSYKEIHWNDEVTYGDIYHRGEFEWGRYYLELSDPTLSRALFDIHEREALNLLENEEVYPAYDLALKCSHIVHMLDARGALSISQRERYIARVRTMAHRCAIGYLNQREKLGFPLLKEK